MRARVRSQTMNTLLKRLVVLILVYGMSLDTATSSAFTNLPARRLFVSTYSSDFECQAVVPWLWRFLAPEGPKEIVARLNRSATFDVQWISRNPYETVEGGLGPQPYLVNAMVDQYAFRWETPPIDELPTRKSPSVGLTGEVRPEWLDEVIARDLRELNRELWVSLSLREIISIEATIEKLEALREKLTGARESITPTLSVAETEEIERSVKVFSQGPAPAISKEQLVAKLILAGKLAKEKNTAAALAVIWGAYTSLRMKNERQRRESRSMEGSELPSWNWFGEAAQPLSAEEDKMVIDADGAVWIFRWEQYRKVSVAGEKEQLSMPIWVHYPDVPTAMRALGHILDNEQDQIRDLVFALAQLEQAEIEPDLRRADELISSVQGWMAGKKVRGVVHSAPDLTAVRRALQGSNRARALSGIHTAKETLITWRLQDISNILKAVKNQRIRLQRLQLEHEESTSELRRFMNMTFKNSGDFGEWTFRLLRIMEKPVFHGSRPSTLIRRDDFKILFNAHLMDTDSRLSAARVQAVKVAAAFKSVCIGMQNTSSWLFGVKMTRYATALSFIPTILLTDNAPAVARQLRKAATYWRKEKHTNLPRWLDSAAKELEKTEYLLMPGSLPLRHTAALLLLDAVSESSEELSKSARSAKDQAASPAILQPSLAATIKQQTQKAADRLRSVELPDLYATLKPLYPGGKWPTDLLKVLLRKAQELQLSGEVQRVYKIIGDEILRILAGPAYPSKRPTRAVHKLRTSS